MDFLNVSYLKKGNNIQKKAYQALIELNVFKNLKSFTPVLTGTIPININIENSDLDIICYCKNFNSFKNEIIHYYGKEAGFAIKEKNIRNIPTIISRFIFHEFQIEIFGQNRPIQEQEAFRHMIIENKVLNERGESFRLNIIELKRQGYKTEPAFAKLLNLNGDPYQELLKFGELLT